MLSKLDFIYVFNYPEIYFNASLERLLLSIESIKDQDITICISNNSKFCIYNEIKKLVPKFKYIHTPYEGPFSKALGINYGVRQMVTSEYFILSDIDLIYSRDHIQRLYLKVEQLKKQDEIIRFVCYNYNLNPLCIKPKLVGYLSKIPIIKRFYKDENYYKPHRYTSDFIQLDQMDKQKGGFAHGNGLIHLETFMKIRGYDEEMIGHGPEDALFNVRISKVNRIIYDNLSDTATLHLWHPPYSRIQVEKNMEVWSQKVKELSNKSHWTFDDVTANIGKEWGKL